MKKVFVFSIILVLFMLYFATGCSNNNAAKSVEIKSNGNNPVKLYGYIIGTPSRDFDLVMDEVNKLLLEDLNCTVEVKYLDWGEYKSQYQLLLAAGDNVDFIFTGHWCMYSEQSSRGAFLEITPDLIKENMPLLYEKLPEKAYSQCKVNGKQYMIPSPSVDKKTDAIVIRQDLADKYGVDTSLIKGYGDLEEYLHAIKENEPDIYPVYLDNSSALWLGIADQYDPLISDSYEIGCYKCFDGNSIDDGIHSMFEPALKEILVDASKKMKRWQDLGYLNKEALANRVTTKESFINGKSAVAVGNFIDIQTLLAEAKANGWDVKMILGTSANGHYTSESYSNNGVAISAFSKHPDLTMKALDLLINDLRYTMLLQFGIEGKHHIIDDNGRVDYPKTVTPNNCGYDWENSGFWFIDRDSLPDRAYWSDDYIKARNRIKDSILKDDPSAGFQFDIDPVKSEYNSVKAVMNQYNTPIILGLVDNVEDAYTELERELKTAGYGKLLAEYQTQVKNYVDKK